MSPLPQPTEQLPKHAFKEGPYVSPNGKVKFCEVPGCGRPMSNGIHHLIDKAEGDTTLPQGVPRFTRVDMLMAVTEIVRRRATCNRGQVGVVIAREGRMISSGYNGSPPGMPHCTDVGCEELTLWDGSVPTPQAVELGCQRTIHAEANALVWAARAGASTIGASMYSTHSPCRACAMLVVSAGITELVYARPYRQERLDILTDGGVKTIQYKAGYIGP